MLKKKKIPDPTEKTSRILNPGFYWTFPALLYLKNENDPVNFSVNLQGHMRQGKA